MPKWAAKAKDKTIDQEGKATFHIHKHTTDLFEDETFLTHCNGEQLSRLLFTSISGEYLRRVGCYASLINKMKDSNNIPRSYIPPNYPPLLTKYISVYPPAGRVLRDQFITASITPLNPYGFSDHQRNLREIQSVGAVEGDEVSAVIVDHTCAVVDNYGDKQGAQHAFTVGIQDGQIAAVCLTASTSVSEISHAVEQLSRRPYFKPTMLFSDTWPNKDKFWTQVFGKFLVGALGLFHYMQRLTKTLRQGHVHYTKALADLSRSVYQYEKKCLAGLIRALSDGTMNGTTYSHSEIQDMLYTSRFKDRYERFLMKEVHDPCLIEHNLRNWFDSYKVDSSDPSRPGKGIKDPRTGNKLFTPDTKEAVLNAIAHAKDIQCPVLLEKMHCKIEAPKGSRHGLPEYADLLHLPRLLLHLILVG